MEPIEAPTVRYVPHIHCAKTLTTDGPHSLNTRAKTVSTKQFTLEEARSLGDRICINWAEVPLEEFRLGLSVELEHGARDPQTKVTDDDSIVTAKIALVHLKEFPDY